jgi:hypothetical protein
VRQSGCADVDGKSLNEVLEAVVVGRGPMVMAALSILGLAQTVLPNKDALLGNSDLSLVPLIPLMAFFSGGVVIVISMVLYVILRPSSRPVDRLER